MSISVFLVDANPTFLRIATRLLQDYYSDELSVVGMAQHEAEALHQVQLLKPQFVLLGLSQHSLNGLQLVPRLRAALEQVNIIVLGTLDIHAYRQAALDSGADAFVPKVALNNDLLPTIRHITTAAE